MIVREWPAVDILNCYSQGSISDAASGYHYCNNLFMLVHLEGTLVIVM